MGINIKYNRNYTVEFVCLFGNNPNKVIVTAAGSHKWTPRHLEMFELRMKKMLTDDLECQQLSAPEPLTMDGVVFQPKVNDMVLVINPDWKGARRAILLNISVTDNMREHPMLSLYLYDHGKIHVGSQKDVSRIPKEYKEKRPAVYMVTVEQVFPTVVCLQENKIEWNKHAATIVQAWMSQPTRDRKLSMKVSFIANGYELIGDFCYFVADDFGTVEADSLTLADFMLQKKVACGLPQYKKLLGLISNEIADESVLPKCPDGKNVRVLEAQDILIDDDDDEEDRGTVISSLSGSEIAMSPLNLKHSIQTLLRKRAICKNAKRGKVPSNFPESISGVERHQMLLEWGYSSEDSESSAGSSTDDGTFSSNYPRSGSTSHDEMW